MSERPGRYTELSQRGIEENSFQGVTLNVGKPSDKTLNQRQFFLSVAKNLEDRLLSQGGRLPDKTGYNKFIEELKVLYAQYWPENAVSLTWQQPERQGRPPPARHGHMVAAVGSKLYIHGGLAGEKFHSDMYSLDTNKPHYV
ncbi:hypothetical protein AAFF_G00253770 [Aldrovandia affinis]|uniref:Rab9 effector protein with kelch motifs n=1 Tax=Aldrovandia affinis TaxID=143900 RepID=A0AAD7SV54_9TELE|nr:hypothetical protein AAFF_G00253770 [Aldrovandia affinis]